MVSHPKFRLRRRDDDQDHRTNRRDTHRKAPESGYMPTATTSVTAKRSSATSARNSRCFNHVQLTDADAQRVSSTRSFRPMCSPVRSGCAHAIPSAEDGTPLHYQLVNLKDWCKNSFEVVSQLRINTRSSFHRYDVILLVNGLPLVQIELKSLQISPRRAMQQIVEYKQDAGNSYTNTLLCFVQLFIVSNRTPPGTSPTTPPNISASTPMRRFLPIYPMGHAGQQKSNLPRRFRRSRAIQMHPRRDDQPLHGADSDRAPARDDAPVSHLCGQGHQRLHRAKPRQRLIWHTTGSGKTLTSFKASDSTQRQPRDRKGALCRGPQGPRPPDPRGVQPFSAGCVEENTNTETW